MNSRTLCGRIAFTLALLSPLGATPLTFTDPYGGQTNSGSNNGDVIGELSKFDIERITVDAVGNAVTVTLLFNYNKGDATLSTFNIGGGFPDLDPGDVLITSGANMWAIALKDHGASMSHPGPVSLVAGQLYQVTGFLTAQTVLGDPGGNYRPSMGVWGDPVGAVNKTAGIGTVTTSSAGGNELQTVLNFSANDATFVNALNGGGYDIQFTNATCANDYLTAVVSASVPEPMSMALIGAGLAGIGLFRRRRRSAA